jgi:hypothetical protein
MPKSKSSKRGGARIEKHEKPLRQALAFLDKQGYRHACRSPKIDGHGPGFAHLKI